MELVYIYDDKIAQDSQGNYYTGSSFSQEIFDRYLQHFDRIRLVMRKSEIAPDDVRALQRMNRIESKQIDVLLLPNPNISIKTYLDPRIHYAFRKIVERSISTDCAVILRAPSASGTIAADYCHAHGIPYLAEAVGCPWDSLWNHSLTGKLFAPSAWIRFRRTMRNAKYAVYVTNEFLQRRYPTNGKSVAVSDVELQPMDESVLLKRLEKIRNHSGKYIIGTAGALHLAYKGQRYVIEALAKLKLQGNTDYEYHLVGGGDASALQTLAEQLGVSNQIVFDGVLRHDQMCFWFDDLDMYIQPSTVESMPRALIEAMSRGLPVFGSLVGDIPVLLEENQVFRKRDAKVIAEKLHAIKTSEMIKMAEDNFQKARSFEKCVLEKKRYDVYHDFSRCQDKKQ